MGDFQIGANGIDLEVLASDNKPSQLGDSCDLSAIISNSSVVKVDCCYRTLEHSLAVKVLIHTFLIL